MPPKPVVRMAGGRRVAKGRRTGPSSEKAKLYRQDDKERLKKAAKKDKGGLRNDTSSETAVDMCKGFGVVVVVSALLFVVVKQVSSLYTPEEVAGAVAAVLETFTSEYGVATACIAVGGTAAYFGATAAYKSYAATQAAATQAAALETAKVEKSARRVKKKEASALAAESKKAAVKLQRAAIAEELAELERIQALAALADSEAAQKQAEVAREAALWKASEQAVLDAAIEASVGVETESAGAEEKWAAIAVLVEGRTAEQCLARIKYCREQADKQAERERADAFAYADASGAEFEEPKKEGYRKWITQTYDDDDYYPDDGGSSTEGTSEDERTPLEVELHPADTGTKLRLRKAMFWNVGTVVPEEVKLLLACTRCSTQTSVTLSGSWVEDSEARQRCTKCTQIMTATLRPCMMHEESDTLGYVETVECTVNDMISVVPKASCTTCPNNYIMPSMKRNSRVEQGCPECSIKLAFQAAAFSHEQLTLPGTHGSGASGGGGARDKYGRGGGKKKSKDTQGIVEGTPLPNNGACTHFKKSLRWLRFGCCGKAFPCPVCHELDGCEGGTNGQLASRMICGKCSKEQNFANSPCTGCGFSMIKGKSAAGQFWNGGGGTRDKTTLSKKDGKKHAGAAKTTSAKASRVGQGASKARDASQNQRKRADDGN